MNKKILLLLPALSLLFTACQKGNSDTSKAPAGSDTSAVSDDSGSGSESGVTGVEVDHETLELQVGQTSKLSASVKPISLDDREVVWSSDHPEIASVDASGMVTAVAQGKAKIKATAHADQTKFAECEVTVTGRMVTIPKLTVADVLNATEELKLGANQKNAGGYYFFKGSVDGSTRGETSNSWAEGVAVKLEAASAADKYLVSFGEGANKKYFEMTDDHHFAVNAQPTAGLEWSWNETYATVQRTISGTTYLPGTYNSYTTVSGCDVAQAANDFLFQFVYQTAPVAPTAITVKAAADKIYQGGELQMEAELAPAAAEGNVVWSVTGDDKVTINKDGLLKAAADATLNAKVTVKAAYDKDASVFGTKEITVAEIINYGSLEAPLTIAQAKAVIDKFPAGSVTSEKLFVKGFVAADHPALNKTTRGDVWLTSDDGAEEKAFELYSVYADEKLGDVAANALVGKEVIAEGWCTVYKGTYEFSAKNPEGTYDNGFIRVITTNTRAATAINLNPAEAFELEQGANKTVSATLLPYGASGTVSFVVAPANQGVTFADGKVSAAADATAGSYTLTATCGALTKSVAFTVKEASGGEVTSLAKYTFSNTANSTAVTDGSTIKGWFSKQSGSDIVSSVSEPSNVYAGANGGSGDNTWSSGNLLKIGKSSAGGSLKISLSQNVKKVIITGYAWKNTLGITINSETVSQALASNLANKANVEANKVGTVEISFSASNTLAISTSATALVITAIEFIG